jgi:peroxiredoxin
VIDVKEPRTTVAAWVKQIKYTFPVLLDPDGKISATYAPPGVQPDLARDQVPIASNLIIDKDGKVRFYSLLDSAHFDAKLLALIGRLDQLLATK